VETILVACETIRDEILRSLDALGLKFTVVWLEGGLHNAPERLRKRLQGVLSDSDGACERLLIAMGYCGGGLRDLTTGNYETVVPLTDDCLSLLLGSHSARRKASVPATYFLTGGWLSHEMNVVSSYEKAILRFDPGTALRLNKVLLEGYSRFGLLNTGVYDLKDAKTRVLPLARGLDLKVEVINSDLSWLHQFLKGPYDNRDLFLRVPPHGKIRFADWLELFSGKRDSRAADEMVVNPDDMKGGNLHGTGA
jgi:hypothetical protein